MSVLNEIGIQTFFFPIRIDESTTEALGGWNLEGKAKIIGSGAARGFLWHIWREKLKDF